MYFLDSTIINTQRVQVRDETHERFGRFYDELCRGVDALILIAYAFNLPDTVPVQPQERVFVYVRRTLYSSFFAFLASLDLIEHGFYTQSISLNRGLMESLVTVIYLADMPAQMDRLPRISVKVKNSLRMRDRFEHVIPGYWESHYKLSSEFTHPGQTGHVLKTRRESDGTLSADLGLAFNEDVMSMCMNELSVLLAGFLKALMEKFRGQLRFRETAHERAVRDARIALANIIDSHVRLKGENDWHRCTKPLWECGPTS
jgi:hypothetical protein